MRPIFKLILAFLAAGCFLTGILLVRTLNFVTRQIHVPPAERVILERDAMIERLSAAIRFKTVSRQNLARPSVTEFAGFHAFLEKAFPLTHRVLSKSAVSELSLLYVWKGRNPTRKPLLLMAHMDVVPADPKTEALWTHPPFAGRVTDGYVWGRGAMDDKVGVMGILEAVEHLLAKGYEPQRTVYLAFGHDEEAGGQEGAGKIAALLRERQVEFEYILDEGGNITEGIIPGLPSPVALIGIAEKGYVSLELSTVASSGHTSTAPPQTAIGILSGAIARLEQARFAPRISLPTRRLLEFVGPEMAWPDKLVMANLWLFEKLVISRMTRSPLTDAAIRTTQAATIFQAGIQENILPARASAVVNFRVLTGETISPVVERARRVINDSRVTITPLPAHAEPSPVSEIESDGFRDIARSLRQIYPHILVAPFLMIAATDSRHFVPFTKNIFRFLPITLRPEDAARYHGIDERVSLKDYEAGVRFYIQLIKNSASKG